MAAHARPVSFHGLEAIELGAGDGARAIVTLQGAQVVSWIPAGGRERLFVSARSPFAAGQPVRGGMPVIFPQFSKRGPLPHHGFVRTRLWQPVQGAGGSERRAAFRLHSSDETLRIWPHAFALELVVAVGGPRLDVELVVRNTGEREFSFTGALHTYLGVTDVARARLEGLPGLGELHPIDRVFVDAPQRTRLVDSGRELEITQRGFRDTVVWNPGRERCEAMTEMEPEGFLRMLCVEAAAAEHPVAVAAGGEWRGGQGLLALTE